MAYSHTEHCGRYKPYTVKDIRGIIEEHHRRPDDWVAMTAVASVLPFRANNYIVEELIDWDNIPDDPIFQLTFPQRGMLDPDDLSRMSNLIENGTPQAAVREAADEIRQRLNPHPAGQTTLNVPRLNGVPLPGMQHKYRETVLFFPSQAQTCHAFCTYCFRWAQFIGSQDLKFAAKESASLFAYLRKHHEVTDILITGGDPMIMKARHLQQYLEPLLQPEFDHIQSIRIGTKSLAYWPQRFVTDDDADDVLRLFERVAEQGKHLALMSHFSHPRELSTPIAQDCIRRIRDTGAEIRCQAPLTRHVNDSGETWAEMWRAQVRLGCIPYYMFVERDTGPKHYFEVPLARALRIYRHAYQNVSGLARTARGPSMSATPGKVQVLGAPEIHGQKVFNLMFIQSRKPEWSRRPFFAKYDPTATWLDDLKPAFGKSHFFWERDLAELLKGGRNGTGSVSSTRSGHRLPGSVPSVPEVG